MRFIDDEADDVRARRVLETVQARAVARRRLALGLPIVIFGALVATKSTLGSSHATPPSRERRAPIETPGPTLETPRPTPHRHAFALLSPAGTDEGRQSA